MTYLQKQITQFHFYMTKIRIMQHFSIMGQYVEFSEAYGLIFTKNESEYPKTEGAIPSGRRPLGIARDCLSFVDVDL